MKLKMTVVACVLALVPALAWAFPEPDGEFLVDLSGTVRGREKLEIARSLRTASESAGVHAMLVVINRVADYPDMPQDIIPFAQKVAADWKVGDSRTHKGVVTLFSLQDRKFAVATSKQLDSGSTLDEAIKASMGGRVTENLRSGNVGGAMRVAASNIAEALPVASADGSSGTSHAEPRRTTTTTTTRRRYQPTWHYSGGSGFVGSLVGLMMMLFVVSMIARAFAPVTGGFGGSQSYGGGGGGGGFFSGMLTGGLLGWMFGGNHGWGGYNYHGYGGHGGGWSEDTTTTTTTESWTSTSDDSSSSSSSFDSFGGGDFSGGGSSGEW